MSSLLVAYAFNQNLFPVYSALKVKTNENLMKTVALALFVVFFFYVFIAIPSTFLFGIQIELQKSNVINNINREYQVDSSHWESFVVRFFFLLVLAAHIPFVFFAGKEGFLIIIDEIDRQSISYNLDERMKALLKKDEMEQHQSMMESHRQSARGPIAETSDEGQQIEHRESEAPTHSRQTDVRDKLQKEKVGEHELTISKRMTIVRETQSIRKGNDEQTLAYKDMKDLYYYSATLIYFIAAILGACFIPEIDIIFEFIASITVNFMGFILPSMFYIKADSMQRKKRENLVGQHNDEQPYQTNKVLLASAYLQLLLGLGAFVVGITNNVLSL